MLQETELSHTSGNGNLLYFEKGIFITLAYLELEAYSKSWNIQNQKIIQNHGIFRTRVYSEHCQTSTMEGFVKLAKQRTFWSQSSKIFLKNFFNFLKRKPFLYFCTFRPSSQNFFSKKSLRKNFLYFGKQSLKTSHILENGTFLDFLKRKLFLYFRKRNPEKSLMFQETEFSYTSGNFSYFKK